MWGLFLSPILKQINSGLIFFSFYLWVCYLKEGEWIKLGTYFLFVMPAALRNTISLQFWKTLSHLRGGYFVSLTAVSTDSFIL